jgi:hypothetical protein
LRISVSELDSLELEHLHSEIDQTNVIGPDNGPRRKDPPLAGYTEWSAEFGARTVSLGWDWYEVEPGVLAVLHPTLLRTNLMLVDEKRADLGRERTVIYLLALIRSIDWYSVVGDYLALPWATRT